MWRKLRATHVVLIVVNIAIIALVVNMIRKSDLLTAHWRQAPALPTPEIEKPKPKVSKPFKPLDVSLKRWAILATPEVQKLGLADQLTALLSGHEGIELVDRDSLSAATRELKLG